MLSSANDRDFPLHILPIPGKAKRPLRGLQVADSVFKQGFITVFQMGRELGLDFVPLGRIQRKTDEVPANEFLSIRHANRSPFLPMMTAD